MPASTWTVTSTKRRTKSLTPFSRKRPRLNDVSTKSSSSRRPRNSQQTLTQAQWLTPPPTSFEEVDGQSTEPGALHSPLTAQPRRTLKKRNSTLTQMDFFSFPPPDDADFDDAMVPLVEGGNMLPPQLDGTHESPRKQRRRKAVPHAAHPTKRKNAPVSEGSQDYRPRTRKRKVEVVGNESLSSRRRTSGRLTSRNEVFSDPAQNLAYFEEALGTITPNNNNNKNELESALGYQRVIKDSNIADIEDNLDAARSISDGRTLLPHTPTKNRGVVLSSQSPESLPPSTHKTSRKTPDLRGPLQRTPLAQRSVNVPLGLMSKLSPHKSRQTPKGSSMKTPKKIVTLKLPKRTQPQRARRTEDSQANLWSIPSSSSPRQGSNPSAQARAQAQEVLHFERPYADAEISATSQARDIKSSPPDIGTQDTLPDVRELIGKNVPDERKVRQAEKPRERRDSSISKAATAPIVRDFEAFSTGGRSLDADTSARVNRFPAESVTALQSGPCSPEHDTIMDVEHSDFGSPIANDTQFNIAVDHRVSSPPPLEFIAQTESTAITVRQLAHSPTPLHRFLTSASKVILGPAPVRTTASSQKPIPMPRLVEQSPGTCPTKVVLDSEDDSDEISLPKPTTQCRSSTHVSTIKIPLNDIVHRSSSPSLPSNKPETPKSVHPASLPHPSQTSTQEATQGYMNMSSYTPEHTEQESEVYKTEKITIKDSSSSHVSMSQLPRYRGESQSQVSIDLGVDGLSTHEEEEEEEEEGDLDLDLPTILPQSERVLTEDQEPATLSQQQAQSQGAKDKAVETENDDLDDHEPDNSQTRAVDIEVDDNGSPIRSSQSISIPSSPNPPRLQRHYSPIPDFDNETQSNFTQNGHVTAAYIHRQHEAGVLPKWYIPQPYQVPGYTRRT